MATALLAFATGGCVDPLDDSLKPQPEQPTLTFWIKVPGSLLATKVAGVGDVASISPESRIYDVQLWAFAHGATNDALPLNYVEKNDITSIVEGQSVPGFENTTQKNWEDSYKIQMPLPKEFVLGADPRVDIYVLANWQSIYDANNKPVSPQQMTLQQVRDLTFGVLTMTSDNFGTTPTTAVPDGKGLPISAVFQGNKDIDGNGKLDDGVSLLFLQNAYNGTATEPLTNAVFEREIGVIELERAVAKVRFAFARTTGMNGVEITKIEINGNLIPNSTYAFPRADGSFALPSPIAYDESKALLGSDASPLFVVPATQAAGDPEIIAQVEDPEALRSDSDKKLSDNQAKAPEDMNAQEYDTFLSAHSTSKLVYIRETNQVISGTIYYKIGDQAKTKTFAMVIPNPDDGYTNLHRNHYWTVYAYFLGNGLYIKPVVLPWEDGSNYTYTQRGSAVVAISTKKETLFGYGWTTAQGNPWYHNKVVSISTRYNASATSTMGEWSDSAPTETDYSTNKFFWTRSAITLQSDPEDASTIHTIYSVPVAKSPKGDGVTAPFVSSISVQYALGESSATAPSTGWSDTAPAWINDNTFIWSRTTTTYTDNTTQTNDVCLFRNTEWYFRRQDEGNTNWAYDWLHSQIVSAPGLNAGGVPIYANRIELRTNGFVVPLRLKLSNTDDFYIVTYNKANAEYIRWLEGELPAGLVAQDWFPSDWSEADGALIPADVSASGTTYFYVVPKEGASHEGKTTEAYLVTDPDDGSGSQKLPFNAGIFPGSNENTEINFYSVSVSTFESYYDASTRPSNIKPYDKSGEVTI